MDEKTFATKLKEERLRVGFTHSALYKALQIPIRTQEDWESGRTKPSAYVQTLVLFWFNAQPDAVREESLPGNAEIIEVSEGADIGEE